MGEGRIAKRAGFLRKVPKSEEGLTRKSHVNVAKTYVVKAASLNEACIRLPQLLSINEDISNLEFPLINWSQQMWRPHYQRVPH